MDAVDPVAPSAKQSEEEAFINMTDDDTFGCDKNETSDIGIEINYESEQTSNLLLPNRMSSEESSQSFSELVVILPDYALRISLCTFSILLTSAQQMNSGQRQIFMHVLHLVKTTHKPFRIFLPGGACVGKSFVLKLTYQALLRYFDTVPR